MEAQIKQKQNMNPTCYKNIQVPKIKFCVAVRQGDLTLKEWPLQVCVHSVSRYVLSRKLKIIFSLKEICV